MSSPNRSGIKSEPTSPERGRDGRQTHTVTKYNLWPRTKKLDTIVAKESFSIPSQDRSPSSLSESSGIPFGAPRKLVRGGSLAMRRKISVPELRKKPSMGTIGAPIVDSPTIPGRPALRTISSDLGQHERSSSYPEERLRRKASRDQMASMAVPQTAIPSKAPTAYAWPLAPHPPEWTTFNPTRPLSPIFSPLESNTPTALEAIGEPLEVRPQVPPKAAARYNTPTQPPPRKDSLGAGSPEISQNHIATAIADKSPTVKKPSSSPRLAQGTEEATSIMDRGRPIVRTNSKKTMSSATKDGFLEYATLPTGLRPVEAALILPDSEKETLRKQASTQAERFEILESQQVTTLSKELRTLDDRCEYLRTTYKTLRFGRQKLHIRMLSYLRSESLTFSKERLVKQEEALVELDKAIDDWAIKIERAENRRLRVRQKLLEHVAAAMMLNLSTSLPAESNSPNKAKAHPEALRVDRKDIESIKIYADTQVLNLFSDIEQAIGRMCEAC